jgi:immune inhibitor A
MKKILFIFTFILFTTASWAAKAYPLPITITQADGTPLTIILRGDEHYHWYMTQDGALLCRQGNAYYVAAVEADGSLTATKQLAHNKDLRSDVERELISKQNKVAFSTRVKAKSARRRASIEEDLLSEQTLFPHSGTPKAVVILAEFQDTPFTITNPRRSFEQYLNGKGRSENYDNGEGNNLSSVAQYFSDMSFKKFIPQFGIYGPVKLPNSLKYYGGNKGTLKDIHYDELIKDACTLMDDSLDFSAYDANNDGYVDLVYIVYAGFSESFTGNTPDCIWPKSGFQNFGKFDGKTVARYGINNELNAYPGAYSYPRINGIGLFCHEFSHTLGLPDLYQSNDACDNNHEMEFWDLMDGGEYTKNGYLPTPYTAWEREAMGWMNIETLSEEGQLQLTPIQEGGKAYRIVNDNATNEYYIIENIQERGWYDAKSNGKSIKGHGMLVYHVDYNKSYFTLGQKPNETKNHPRMTVVAADGLLLSSTNCNDSTLLYYQEMNGDPFPGTSGVTSLTDDMTRQDGKSMLYTYTGKLNKPIYNIKEDEDGVISFDFMKDYSETGISKPIIYREEQDQRIFTIDGRYAGTDLKALPRGLYIIGKRKVQVK